MCEEARRREGVEILLALNPAKATVSEDVAQELIAFFCEDEDLGLEDIGEGEEKE